METETRRLQVSRRVTIMIAVVTGNAAVVGKRTTAVYAEFII